MKEAFSKTKRLLRKAKTGMPEALFEATHLALSVLIAGNSHGFLGYSRHT